MTQVKMAAAVRRIYRDAATRCGLTDADLCARRIDRNRAAVIEPNLRGVTVDRKHGTTDRCILQGTLTVMFAVLAMVLFLFAVTTIAWAAFVTRRVDAILIVAVVAIAMLAIFVGESCLRRIRSECRSRRRWCREGTE